MRHRESIWFVYGENVKCLRRAHVIPFSAKAKTRALPASLENTQGPSKTAKNSRFGQNAKVTPSEADFIAEQPCGGHFQLKCLTLMIFRFFFGTFSRHFLLARNSPGRPGRNILLPGLPENFKIPGKSSAWLAWDTLYSRLARQENLSAWPAWRVSSQ